jgi:hypothetical protein
MLAQVLLLDTGFRPQPITIDLTVQSLPFQNMLQTVLLCAWSTM